MDNLVLQEIQDIDVKWLVKTLEKLVKILSDGRWKIHAEAGFLEEKSEGTVSYVYDRVESRPLSQEGTTAGG